MMIGCSEEAGIEYVLEHRDDVVCQADEFTLLNIFLTFFDRYPKPDEDMWVMCKKRVRV